MHAPDADQRSAVRETVARISAAWQGRRYDALAACFDEAMVIAARGADGRVEGREACVASYREFMERVTITAYQEEPPAVDVWVDTAVATYRWAMAWDAGGTPNHETGADVFVLRRDAATGAWRAVWRTLVSASGRPGA